jgi:hypothetical protein
MKRIFIFFLLATLALGFVAQSLNAHASTLQDPTPKPTRVRTRIPKKTPPPAATPIPDTSAEPQPEESAAIPPTSPGAMTSQILIFNPDPAGDATVQLDVYNTSGAVSYSTTTTIARNGAKLVSLPGSVGANFQGGAQISSDKNVQAIVIGSNVTKSALDAYEGSSTPALDVTLPFVRHLTANTQNSILSIQNTTETTANITLTLYNSNGAMATQQNAALAAHQIVYYNTNSLINAPPFVGSARVTSDQNVAVAMQALYFRDTAALIGMTASEMDTTVFLNQAQRKVNGASIVTNWSEIFAHNNGANPTDITIEFYSPTGALVTSQTASAVPVNGTAQFLLNDVGFAALGNNFNGWAKITSSGEPLAVSALQVLGQGKRLYGTNGVAGTGTSTRYVCGDAERNTTENSTISILNLDPVASPRVQIKLFNPTTGAKVAAYTVKVAPGSLTNVLLSSTPFANAGTAYQGMAIVQAKGVTPSQLIVTVNNPYANPKPSGTSGYTCAKFQ